MSRHDQQPHQFAASSMDGCVDNQDYNDGAQDDHPIGQFNACYRCPFAKPFHDYPLPIFKQRLTKAKSRRVQGLFCLSFFTGDGQTRQCVGLTLIHLLVSDREPSADDATNSHFTAHGLYGFLVRHSQAGSKCNPPTILTYSRCYRDLCRFSIVSAVN